MKLAVTLNLDTCELWPEIDLVDMLDVEKEIVGFGFPCCNKLERACPDGTKSGILFIPMLKIAERFQGHPLQVEWRFSQQTEPS